MHVRLGRRIILRRGCNRAWCGEYAQVYRKSQEGIFLGKDCRSLVGYEAGSTGYGSCRWLQKKRYDCVTMAHTTIKKSSSDKRNKTAKTCELNLFDYLEMIFTRASALREDEFDQLLPWNVLT